MKTMDKLERKGVILSYRTHIDNSIVCGGFYAVVSIKARLNDIKRLIQKLLQIEEIYSIYLVAGEYDLEAICELDSQEEFEKLLMEKLSSIKEIERARSEILLRTYHHGKDVFEPSSLHGEEKSKIMKFDETDRKILDLLRHNGRASQKWIGKQIGVSAPIVSMRMRRLERLRVICGYYVIVDYTKLGFCLQASVRLRVDPQKFKNVLDRILQFKPLWMEEILGETDLHFRVNAIDTKVLRKLIRDEIGQADGVQRIDSHIIFRSYHRSALRSIESQLALDRGSSPSS
jgi:DNA-binding Lrp family transcriptional regulator